MRYRKLVRGGSWWDIWTVLHWRLHCWRWTYFTRSYVEIAVGPLRVMRAKGAGA
jgi:hypothetical protein